MTELELGPLKFGIIGAGRLGCTIGRALQRVGFELVHASSASSEGRDRASRLLQVPVHEDPVTVSEAVDCVVICVPDDALDAVVAQLAARPATASPLQLRIVSTSAVGGVQRLAPLAASGHAVGVLHPVATVAELRDDLDPLTGAGAAIGCADDATRTFLHALAHALELHPFDVEEAGWPLHAAACTTIATGIASVLAAADDLAADADIHDGVARAVYGRLAAIAVERAVLQGPVESLEGPILRGDAAAVARQVQAARTSTNEVDALFIPIVATMANRAFTRGRIDMQTHRNVLEAILDPTQFDAGEQGGPA